jgi:hypothetical protein
MSQLISKLGIRGVVHTKRCLILSNHPSQPTISRVYQDTQQLCNYQE